MSMNLHCDQVALWQTPTHISYMIMMESDGVHYEATGLAAKRALLSYKEWVTSTLPSVITADMMASYKFDKEQVQNHLSEVDKVLDNSNLCIYIM